MAKNEAASAVTPEPAKAPKFDPTKVKVLKSVTLPVFKQQDNVPQYVKILEPIFTGKEIKAKDGEKAMPAGRDRAHRGRGGEARAGRPSRHPLP